MHHRVDEVRCGHGPLPAELGWDDGVEAACGGEDQSLAREALEAFADGVAAALEKLRGFGECERVYATAEQMIREVGGASIGMYLDRGL